MPIKNRFVLAIALVVGSSSFALAQGFDPNLGNRIPQLNSPGVYGYQYGRNGPGLLPPAQAYLGLQSAPVGLYGGGYGSGYSGHALRTAPVGLYEGYAPGISVVGPDNYRNWRQACCF